MMKSIQPRLTELGKIKIGRKEAQERKSKTGEAWRKPEKLDHFLITTRERDAAGDLVVDEALMKLLLEQQGGSGVDWRLPPE